jgi:hypothetical protein
MIDEWSRKSLSRLDNNFPIYIILLILFLFSIFGLIYSETVAQAQVSPEEPSFKEVTVKLAGGFCDVNAAESAVLHLKGVIMVDIETRKGYLIVAYDPEKVSPQQMVEAVGKKTGKDGACTATVVGVGQP